MHVLVFEPSHSGHRFVYVRLLVDQLLALGQRLTIATGTDAPSSPEYAAHLAPVASRVEFHLLPHQDGHGLTGAVAQVLRFRRAIRAVRPDHVYVPTADGLTQVLGLARRVGLNAIPDGVEAEALLMRGSFAYPGARPIKARVTLAGVEAAPWSRLHLIDPIPYEYLRRRGGRAAGRCRLMPDPIDPQPPLDKHASRRSLRMPEGGRIVGSFGLQDERKGVDLLVAAFARAATSLRNGDRLLLMGRLSDGVRAALAGHATLVDEGRIVLFDRFVTDQELREGLSACDVVCTPYPRHVGSASIAIRAAAARRPVLSSGWGWLGHVVPRLGLGQTCEVTDVDAFAAAIVNALDASPAFRLTEAGERYLEFQSFQNSGAAWTERIRGRLGLPPSPHRRSWDWVLNGDPPRHRG